VDALSRPELEVCLELAADLRQRRNDGRSLPSLAGQAVGLAFFEPSTRTRVSFELAARALEATVIDLSIAGSSAIKGESLIDTLRTLERSGVTMAILRHAAAGAPYLATRTTGATSSASVLPSPPARQVPVRGGRGRSRKTPFA
jgi:aspartate carbamoyltransferase catalytic subunit